MNEQSPVTTARSTLLRVDAVRKLYQQTEAIRNVSIEVVDGEFVSLLGPSGCGKSTLLMMMAGLVEPTEGRITLNGENVYRPRPGNGVVVQQPVLLPWGPVLCQVPFSR